MARDAKNTNRKDQGHKRVVWRTTPERSEKKSLGMETASFRRTDVHQKKSSPGCDLSSVDLGTKNIICVSGTKLGFPWIFGMCSTKHGLSCLYIRGSNKKSKKARFFLPRKWYFSWRYQKPWRTKLYICWFGSSITSRAAKKPWRTYHLTIRKVQMSWCNSWQVSTSITTTRCLGCLPLQRRWSEVFQGVKTCFPRADRRGQCPRKHDNSRHRGYKHRTYKGFKQLFRFLELRNSSDLVSILSNVRAQSELATIGNRRSHENEIIQWSMIQTNRF